MSIERIEAWAAAEPIARETEVILAARGPSLGPREWLDVIAIVRRPGRFDSRYRDVRVAGVRVRDEAAERETLAALERIASALGARLEVRPPSPGAPMASLEWLERAGPPPLAPWTVRWSMRALDDQGREVPREDERIVEARTAFDARDLARAARVAERIEPDPLPPGSASRADVVEIEDGWSAKPATRPTPERFDIRARIDAGVAPTELLDAMRGSPADAILVLADAWFADSFELLVAGAYLRREISRDDADRALREVSVRHEHAWKLALRLHEALDRDVVSEELEAMARTRSISLVRVICDVLPDLSPAQCKRWVGLLDQAGAEVRAPGTLSRTLAVVRGRGRR